MGRVREKAVVLMLLIALLVPVVIVAKTDASPAPLFLVNPYRVTTLVGTTIPTNIVVTIEISNLAGPTTSGENLYGWQARISWTPANLEYISATEGPMLKQGGASTIWVAPVANQLAGTLDLADARSGSVPGVIGSGVLATITFRVDVAAATDLTLSMVKLRNNLLQALAPNSGAPDYYFTNLRNSRYGPRAAYDIYVASNYEAIIDIFDMSTVGINYGKSGTPGWISSDVSGPTPGVPDGTISVYDLAYMASHYGYYF